MGCSQLPKSENSVAQSKPDWIQQSDRIAEEFTKSLAVIHPEDASELGYSEFDGRGLLLDSETEDRDREIFVAWTEKLTAKEATTSDLELKIDIAVLKNWIQNHIQNIDIYRQAREVGFLAGTQFVFENLQPLVTEQSSTQKKNAVVDRFRVYVYGDANHKPLLEAMQSIFMARLNQYKEKNILAPFRGEVERYLKDSPTFLSSIKEMLRKSDRTDWNADFQKFAKQASVYDQFVKSIVLPKSRTNARLPKAIYAQILKRRGIESEPLTLIQRGLADYKKIYRAFEIQAVQLAKKYHLKKSHPASVIQFLKSKPVTDSEEIKKLYRQTSDRLEQIMKEHDLISVPASPLRIRFAGAAESLSMPVPSLIRPPSVNNRGERPEFVIPSSLKGIPFDDFSSPYSAIILTAHEGRPGHDMQFSQMLDMGQSIIRSLYANNNVNIEGWALYAEDLVYPYILPEEQFFATQTRLWRVARMFLDPQLQLAQIPDQRVIDVFTKELGVSKTMAKLELVRYKFEDIGQAPSYYEGYLIVKKMRTDAEKRLGNTFRAKCFNDKLLSFGLLPLRISAERMENELVCNN